MLVPACVCVFPEAAMWSFIHGKEWGPLRWTRVSVDRRLLRKCPPADVPVVLWRRGGPEQKDRSSWALADVLQIFYNERCKIFWHGLLSESDLGYFNGSGLEVGFFIGKTACSNYTAEPQTPNAQPWTDVSSLYPEMFYKAYIQNEGQTFFCFSV